MKHKKLFQFILIVIVAISCKNAEGQLPQWSNDGNDIYNRNSGNVLIGSGSYFSPLHKLYVLGDIYSTSRLTWNDGNSILSDDLNGSIELGINNVHGKTPYIDFHYGTAYGGQDFNTRLMNSANNTLDLMYSNGAKTRLYS